MNLRQNIKQFATGRAAILVLCLSVGIPPLSCDTNFSSDVLPEGPTDGSSVQTNGPVEPISGSDAPISSFVGACCFGAECSGRDPGCCQELQVDQCVAAGGVFVESVTGCGSGVCAIIGVIARERDIDGDGRLNADDPDVDGDGIQNGADSDVDGDGIPNGADKDVDGDGEANGSDKDVDGDGVENGKDEDADGDGLEFAEDDDDDGDGVKDEDDEDDCEEDCKHGDCFNKNCHCEPGWEGDACDKFHCKDIRNCNNGTCVGPNVCRCDPGWESVGSIPCAVYHCRQLKECNEHGKCVGANKCECDAEWRGLEDCSIHSCDRDPTFCDDNDPCTKNECDPATGCKPATPLCDSTETCFVGTCLPKCRNTLDCASGSACRDGACQDGCFLDDECKDGDPCTTDTCNEASDCENRLIHCSDPHEICVRGRCVTACLDSDACEEGELCRESGCFAECDGDRCQGEDETCEGGACVPPEDDTDPDNN